MSITLFIIDHEEKYLKVISFEDSPSFQFLFTSNILKLKWYNITYAGKLLLDANSYILNKTSAGMYAASQ